MFDFNQTLAILLKEEVLISDDETVIELYHQRLLRDYSNYELTLMIDASIALDILMPFALDLLQENIFLEGDAELLESALVAKGYWQSHPSESQQLESIINDNIKLLNKALATLKNYR